MQSPNVNNTRSKPTESLATLWLRLEELLCAVDDVRSAALVVGNMARYKQDHDLAELAEGLHGVHSTLYRRVDEVLRELRQCLANDYKDQSEARSPASDAA